MYSVGTGISGYLSKASPASVSALRIAQNNTRFANAIRLSWPESPDSAEYLLAHVNGLYIAPDKRPRKSGSNEAPPLLLGVYVDDPLVRTELNARRETVAFSARQQGLSFDEVLIHASRGGMRERFAFPESRRYIAALFGETIENDASEGEPEEGRIQGQQDNSSPYPYHPRESAVAFAPSQKEGRATSASGAPSDPPSLDQGVLMEEFRRAACLTFPDLAQAQGLLQDLEGVYFESVSVEKRVECHKTEAAGVRRRRRGRSVTVVSHYCHLFVPPHLVGLKRRVLGRWEATLVSKAADLGLGLKGIYAHPSPAAVAGRIAYPRAQAPCPLPAMDVQELRQLRVRYEGNG